MQRRDFAFIEAGGRRFDFWTSYSFDSDLFTPADGFRFGVGLPGIRTPDDKRRRDELIATLSPGSEVKIYVSTEASGFDASKHLQMTGVVDDLTIKATSDGGTEIELEGRDRACHLCDSSVPLDVFKVNTVRKRRIERSWDFVVNENSRQPTNTGAAPTSPAGFSFETNPGIATTVTEQTWTVKQGMTLAQLAIVVADLWGITVTVDASASRDILTGRPRGTAATVDARRSGRSASYASGQSPDTVKAIKVAEARPHPGEAAWEYLDRHAKRLGVMMWFSPDGKLVLSSPQYTQASRGRIVRRFKSDPRDPNNVLDGQVKRSIGDRYSQVTAMGRSNRAGKTKISVTAVDPAWALGFTKPLTVQDNDLRTLDAAQRRAERELAKHKASAVTLHYVLPEHGYSSSSDRFLYAPDTMVDVEDEITGISGRYYVTKRTFTCDRQNGTTTTLALVPPDSIVL